jgi:NAD(P)-dependent dehydrogenase (short-subunit alcohol dehydrogenase family)
MTHEADAALAAPGVAWVTGAAQGIGRAIAVELASRGFEVWLTDLDGDGLAESAKEVTAAGDCVACGCDVTSPEDVERVAARILAESGRLDVVVNNAGVTHVDDLLDVSFDTWRRVMAVNADGTFLVGQAAARRMVAQPLNPVLRRRGLIVNVGSEGAERGRPPHAAYGASKAVVKHLTMTQALALRERDVASVLLYPGEVLDGMLGRMYDLTGRARDRPLDEVVAEAAAALPNGFQPAADIGRMVGFLAESPGMAFSGQVLWCDAGLRRI